MLRRHRIATAIAIAIATCDCDCDCALCMPLWEGLQSRRDQKRLRPSEKGSRPGPAGEQPRNGPAFANPDSPIPNPRLPR